jgi:hypothetical protein
VLLRGLCQEAHLSEGLVGDGSAGPLVQKLLRSCFKRARLLRALCPCQKTSRGTPTPRRRTSPRRLSLQTPPAAAEEGTSPAHQRWHHLSPNEVDHHHGEILEHRIGSCGAAVFCCSTQTSLNASASFVPSFAATGRSPSTPSAAARQPGCLSLERLQRWQLAESEARHAVEDWRRPQRRPLLP